MGDTKQNDSDSDNDDQILSISSNPNPSPSPIHIWRKVSQFYNSNILIWFQYKFVNMAVNFSLKNFS